MLKTFPRNFINWLSIFIFIGIFIKYFFNELAEREAIAESRGRMGALGKDSKYTTVNAVDMTPKEKTLIENCFRSYEKKMRDETLVGWDDQVRLISTTRIKLNELMSICFWPITAAQQSAEKEGLR